MEVVDHGAFAGGETAAHRLVERRVKGIHQQRGGENGGGRS
jgi:hypothetical protein